MNATEVIQHVDEADLEIIRQGQKTEAGAAWLRTIQRVLFAVTNRLQKKPAVCEENLLKDFRADMGSQETLSALLSLPYEAIRQSERKGD